MRYTTKPITIEAVQWKVDSDSDVHEFCYDAENDTHRFNSGTHYGKHWAEVYDYLQDTWASVNLNDYIIRGTKGEYYPCNSEVFEQKYEPDNSLGWHESEFTK